jgi:hypothetical protein
MIFFMFFLLLWWDGGNAPELTVTGFLLSLNPEKAPAARLASPEE